MGYAERGIICYGPGVLYGMEYMVSYGMGHYLVWGMAHGERGIV